MAGQRLISQCFSGSLRRKSGFNDIGSLSLCPAAVVSSCLRLSVRLPCPAAIELELVPGILSRRMLNTAAPRRLITPREDVAWLSCAQTGGKLQRCSFMATRLLDRRNRIRALRSCLFSKDLIPSCHGAAKLVDMRSVYLVHPIGIERATTSS
jgi:hypothetical protein